MGMMGWHVLGQAVCAPLCNTMYLHSYQLCFLSGLGLTPFRKFDFISGTEK